MYKETSTIKYFVEKSKEKTYIKIPFSVPKNVGRIDISYFYEGMNKNSKPIGEKNVIDIAILDIDGNEVGATGSAYKSISFGETYSSRGYRRVSLTEGTWYIILGAYLIKDGGTEIKYEITYYYKEFSWLKGDPHLHTLNSDGKYSYDEIAKIAIKNKLDYIVITDHNNFINGELPLVNNLSILKGVEITNYYGHMNIIGAKIPYSGTHAVSTFEDFLKLSKQSSESGALRIINHPTCNFIPWKWSLDFDFEGLEVWNSFMRYDNLDGVELWHNELKKGKKLIAVGGSDFHSMPKLIFARPVTAVYALSSNETDILNAMKKGNAVLLRDAKTPMLEISCNNAIAGDSVIYKNGLKVTVKAEKLRRGEALIVYSQKGEIFKLIAKKTMPFSVDIPITEHGFIRAEIRAKKKFFFKFLYSLFIKIATPKYKTRKDKLFIVSMTNPIYFDEKK